MLVGLPGQGKTFTGISKRELKVGLSVMCSSCGPKDGISKRELKARYEDAAYLAYKPPNLKKRIESRDHRGGSQLRGSPGISKRELKVYYECPAPAQPHDAENLKKRIESDRGGSGGFSAKTAESQKENWKQYIIPLDD